jgi:hypothetical protein
VQIVNYEKIQAMKKMVGKHKVAAISDNAVVIRDGLIWVIKNNNKVEVYFQIYPC